MLQALRGIWNLGRGPGRASQGGCEAGVAAVLQRQYADAGMLACGMAGVERGRKCSPVPGRWCRMQPRRRQCTESELPAHRFRVEGTQNQRSTARPAARHCGERSGEAPSFGGSPGPSARPGSLDHRGGCRSGGAQRRTWPAPGPAAARAVTASALPRAGMTSSHFRTARPARRDRCSSGTKKQRDSETSPWCRVRDLNPRPSVYKTAALPLC